MQVGVVGAGLSGLMLTHELTDQGVSVQTFEARGRPGGIIWSRQHNGQVLELGPQRLRATPQLTTLVDTLGLADQLRRGDDTQPLYLYWNDDLYTIPLSVREAITTDLLSLSGKLRILLEPVTGDGQPDESVNAFLTRKFGAEAAQRCFGPLYSGLYGTDPREMLMKYSLGRALDNAGINGSILLWAAAKLLRGRDTPPIYTFDDGLGVLPKRLYEAHADSIALAEPVNAIKRDGDAYQLITSDRTIRVDEVVLTTPAPVTAELLAEIDVDVATTLRQFRYNPIGMVFLESTFDQPGIGTLVPSDSDLPVSGLTWNASFLDRDQVFTAYLDPSHYPAVSQASADTLGAVAAQAFETITGTTATPIDVHRWLPGMPAYDRSWTALDELTPPSGIHLCANYVGRPGIPGRLRRATTIAQSIASEYR